MPGPVFPFYSYPVPPVIRKAFDDADAICITTGYIRNINLSSEETLLIQETGRWTERFCSDLLISLRPVLKLDSILRPDMPLIPDNTQETHMLLFGMRKDGIDGTAFIMNRLKDTISYSTKYPMIDHVYRRIYAWEFTFDSSDRDGDGMPKITAILKRIDGCIRAFSDEDMNYNPYPDER